MDRMEEKEDGLLRTILGRDYQQHSKLTSAFTDRVLHNTVQLAERKHIMNKRVAIMILVAFVCLAGSMLMIFPQSFDMLISWINLRWKQVSWLPGLITALIYFHIIRTFLILAFFALRMHLQRQVIFS